MTAKTPSNLDPDILKQIKEVVRETQTIIESKLDG